VADGQAQVMDFQLKAGGNNLNEVVVTGYSKQSKRDVTGAASTVSADVIEQTPVTTVESALEGRVAGVTWMVRVGRAIRRPYGSGGGHAG
jgi:hypothetical protein